jgi:GT2 family glycosyltransferase
MRPIRFLTHTMEKNKASVIIPNWNGLELLRVCLKSLENQTLKDFEVIVVDNGSKDGSVEYIEKFYPKTKVIKLQTNTGFAFAVNRGVENSEGKYIFLLNNDTEVDKNCIKKLVDTAEKNPDVSFIAAKLINFYKRDLIDSAGDYIDDVGHADNIGRGKKDGEEFSKPGPVFLVTGGGCLIRKDVFDKVGLLDEDYFMYFEDVDFGFRAQLLGHKGYFEPKAIIYHIQKASSNRNKTLVEYLQFRNMTMTIIKNFPKGLLLYKFNWLRIFWVNINTIRFLATKGYLKEALEAEGYILLNFFKLLKKRKDIQSKKVVSDDYIINNVRRKKLTLFGLFPKGI